MGDLGSNPEVLAEKESGPESFISKKNVIIPRHALPFVCTCACTCIKEKHDKISFSFLNGMKKQMFKQ